MLHLCNLSQIHTLQTRFTWFVCCFDQFVKLTTSSCRDLPKTRDQTLKRRQIQMNRKWRSSTYTYVRQTVRIDIHMTVHDSEWIIKREKIRKVLPAHVMRVMYDVTGAPVEVPALYKSSVWCDRNTGRGTCHPL